MLVLAALVTQTQVFPAVFMQPLFGICLKGVQEDVLDCCGTSLGCLLGEDVLFYVSSQWLVLSRSLDLWPW